MSNRRFVARPRSIVVAVLVVTAWLSAACAGPPVTWTTEHLPSGLGAVVLQQVSCATEDLCVAPTSGTSVLVRASGQWHTVNDPALTGMHSMGGVSCPSATYCVVAGARTVAGAEIAALVEYDGTAWHAVTLDLANQPLQSVSCSAPDACVAVGATLAIASNGGWHSIPPLPATGPGQLTKIACQAAGNCFVRTVTLPWTRNDIVHWDGHRWATEYDTPGVGSEVAVMDIACSATGRCVAAGTRALQPAMLERVGTSWIPVTAPGFDPKILEQPAVGASAVSCTSSGRCVALIGNFSFWDSTQARRTIVSDDTGWWSESTPPPTGANLATFSCLSTGCVAVGSATEFNQPRTPTAAHLAF